MMTPLDIIAKNHPNKSRSQCLNRNRTPKEPEETQRLEGCLLGACRNIKLTSISPAALVYFCDTSWQSSLISEALWFLLIALLMVTLCNIKAKNSNKVAYDMKIKQIEEGVAFHNQRLTLITPWDLNDSPCYIKAKFKVHVWTFKLIASLPLHRISS